MNRTLLGAFATLILMAAGLFWWQGRAIIDPGPDLPLLSSQAPDPVALPSADQRGMRGPELPQATEQTREQRRFDRLDRDRNGRISRVEMLVPRAALFRKLDVDGNNLLTFEEWAVLTASRFKLADRNVDSQLDRIEFATTKPKDPVQPACKCVASTLRRNTAKPAKSPAERPDAELDEDGQPTG